MRISSTAGTQDGERSNFKMGSAAMSIELPVIANQDCYCVFGNPIAHSKSPEIHAQFARQTGRNLIYSAVLVPENAFAAYVQRFGELGGKGANVTLPFKHEAWTLCLHRSARAERAGAVNTLWFDASGHLCGDNTDGVGLVRDMTVNHGWKLEDARILLVGAGGAARGVLPALLACRPRRLYIANRTPARALELTQAFVDLGPIQGGDFGSVSGHFDYVVNATSASLHGEVPALAHEVMHGVLGCYDMMYGRGLTAFNAWAGKEGVRNCVDGLGMLVEQAAEAFLIWHGVRPQTAPVLAQLRMES
jgi:shikimate dehydrogenase